MANNYGVHYLRTSRRKTMRIYKDGAEFTVGKANKLAEGKDICIIASGIMVYEALKAADLLAELGVSARVLDMHTIKPLDIDAVTDAAKDCGAIVTAENHNVTGGLGAAVCEALAESVPVPVERVGVKESFGEVGTQDYLQKRFGLTAENIVSAAEKCISRKNK